MHENFTLPIPPTPQQNPNMANAIGWLVESVISPRTLLETPTLPFKAPHRQRESTAITKLGDRPNISIVIVFPIRPINKTGRRPYRSESDPHRIDVKNWARK